MEGFATCAIKDLWRSNSHTIGSKKESIGNRVPFGVSNSMYNCPRSLHPTYRGNMSTVETSKSGHTDKSIGLSTSSCQASVRHTKISSNTFRMCKLSDHVLHDSQSVTFPFTCRLHLKASCHLKSSNLHDMKPLFCTHGAMCCNKKSHVA